MIALIRKRWLVFKVLPLLAAILGVKYLAHLWGWEVIELNTLFTAIISANVFLLGFLLAGVLADFKEGEKLPGDMSISIDAILDEVFVLRDSKRIPQAEECLSYIAAFIEDLKRWFHKEIRTKEILAKVRGLSRFFSAFESHLPANFVVRLKQEQSALRRHILRVDTIRDTSFVASGYRIAQLNSAFLIIGLIFVSVDPFSNAFFFTAIISFLFIYMLALIKDLDNPFGFYMKGTAEDVPLRLLENLQERLVEEKERRS